MFFGQEGMNRKNYAAGFILMQIHITLFKLRWDVKLAYCRLVKWLQKSNKQILRSQRLEMYITAQGFNSAIKVQF